MISPGAALDINRADRFTASPITVYTRRRSEPRSQPNT